ncbi:helix-turn-helix transcriptional regulator [Pseudomonas fluorescens]|nr:AraC family transcriptional regulator [Pseudomonas fluorescens]
MGSSTFSSCVKRGLITTDFKDERTDYRPFTETPWQVAYDYGEIFYCTASKKEEHLELAHHMIGVELAPGIVRTRLDSGSWSSDIMLSGALYYVAAGSTIHVKKEQPIDFVLATISPECADQMFREAGLNGPSPSMAFNMVDPGVHLKARALRQMLLCQDEEVGSFASDFVKYAFRQIVKSHHGDQRSVRYQLAPHQVRTALEFIEENLSSTLSVEQVAQEALGISSYYFAHAFTEMLGCSPHKYIMDRRLSKAHELILSSVSSLADISYRVGFSSQAHMTSTFSKRFGVTPGQLRQCAI